ncbi:vasculin-like [Physella acuta]|uniref:vasculin-like n=1 Tax=Physella acuta TaxID=109671 RepID=UPI0027DE3FEA|nr:vasculin-like [Physella acuta]XP_059141961.1 vasculin-like [Physella acuta]XP_059141962.1 vasculin-like [Physella acuta]XP_059141963.1 vasculin-like [Physella acuta]
MAESNVPKQDFAPPWLKFPTTDSSKSQSQKLSNYQGERNRQRREDPYHPRSDYNRLHRQTSFDFHDSKRYPPSQGKYRHHSVDDDYYGYPYNYGYYAPNYNYEKYSMQYSSQPSLARQGSRDTKYNPGRFPQVNGADFSPHYELYEPPYYHQGPHKRSHYDKDYHKDTRDDDGKNKNKGNERDRPFTDDFPSLVGSGETVTEVKPTKPASGVWENPPKPNRNEESPDLLKNTSPGIYKALVPSKNGQVKKNGREPVRMNGSIRDSSPLSPSNKTNHKEVTRQSPTPDLAIVTQPKKLGDKKSDFLRAIRNESSPRNGDSYQDQNQNAIDKKQPVKDSDESPMNEEITYSQMNGNHIGENESGKHGVNSSLKVNGDFSKTVNGESYGNGEALINEVDHINLSGEEEEKRLLLSMGWVEEDNTEYVITDDEIREFQHRLKNHCNGQKNGLKTTLRNALNFKPENNFTNGLLNATLNESEENDKNKTL